MTSTTEKKMKRKPCPGCQTPGQPHGDECESEDAILQDIDEVLRLLGDESEGP